MLRLLALLALLPLAACSDVIPGNPGELAMSEGYWGWDQGAGCEGLTNALHIDGETLTFYEDGEPVLNAFLDYRDLIHSERTPGTRHRLEQVEWVYTYFDDEAGGGVWRREVFYVDYLATGLKWLTHWERFETEPGGTDYSPLRDFPTRRNRLVPCRAE